jgi:hypothetical protein
MQLWPVWCIEMYEPKEYYDKARYLRWGENLTSEQMSAMKQGETFILLDQIDRPYAIVLMDSRNKIRTNRI